MKQRAIPSLAVTAAALITGCAGCGASRPAVAPSTRSAAPAGPAGQLADGDVAVSAVLDPGPGGTGRVRVTFAPRQSGYHLYSISLPPGGVSGLGTPTIVAARGDLRAAGKASANKPVRDLRLAELNVTLPVYPDGPVTVTLPVRRAAAGRPSVAVTYGACSAETCLPPVRGRVVPLP
jgi:hypothetical protein